MPGLCRENAKENLGESIKNGCNLGEKVYIPRWLVYLQYGKKPLFKSGNFLSRKEAFCWFSLAKVYSRIVINLMNNNEGKGEREFCLTVNLCLAKNTNSLF